ncbi:aminoglycoside 3-N-acetyltransferase [Azospirillum thermophilum]|uniref:Aminoglycoside N(3)-acetyltransferase n=1 Tax=Azospirillum thermophilum TaxID=2202148 RepID=A0A2S2CSC1_9PROT|nr:aminoglycoside 3-N-acetyltransferase [Azospirillum thermophilum]AWK87376.1 aminoglycoside 3-N-acetyltransferase [Azospirillum thermophilum]
MIEIGEDPYWSRRELRSQLEALGVEPGDSVMIHAAMRSAGEMLNGPDALIGAILDAVGPRGTLLAYVNWDAQYEDALDEEGMLPPALKPDIPPFDPAASRASRDHGVIAEFVRTYPGARRSGNPGASVAAIGARADWFVADHPLDYGYGEGSPFAKLVEAGGKVLMVGAPLDTVSLLHHAEHLARIPGKHVRRMETPFLVDGRVEWRVIEEFDTVDPVVDGLDPGYFGTIVRQFLDQGGGRTGEVGSAGSVLLPAADLLRFGVRWLEERCGR